MVYIPIENTADGVAKVVYTSKDGRTKKTFDAIDRLAQLVVHIPDKFEQMVRYYGFYVASSLISPNILKIVTMFSTSIILADKT